MLTVAFAPTTPQSLSGSVYIYVSSPPSPVGHFRLFFFMSVVVNLVNMNLSLLNFINRTSLSAGSFSKYNKSHLYFKVYWYYVIFQTTINRLRYDFIFLGSKRKTSYNFHTTWRWCPPSRRHFTLRGVKEQIFGGNCPESNSGGHCLCDITWHDMTSRDTFGTVSHD